MEEVALARYGIDNEMRLHANFGGGLLLGTGPFDVVAVVDSSASRSAASSA